MLAELNLQLIRTNDALIAAEGESQVWQAVAEAQTEKVGRLQRALRQIADCEGDPEALQRCWRIAVGALSVDPA